MKGKNNQFGNKALVLDEKGHHFFCLFEEILLH